MADLDETLAAVRAEVLRARAKFPGRAHMLAALTEEVGEVARALLDGEGRERVRAEAIQVACVALRIARGYSPREVSHVMADAVRGMELEAVL